MRYEPLSGRVDPVISASKAHGAVGRMIELLRTAPDIDSVPRGALMKDYVDVTRYREWLKRRDALLKRIEKSEPSDD